MSFFFISSVKCYSMILTRESHDDMLQISTKIPVFLLCYSPYCSFCVKVHPIWKQLMEKYQNNTKIVIAELNCAEYNDKCAFHNIMGYPSFMVVIDRQSTKQVNIVRNLESFSEKVEYLIKNSKYSSLTCNTSYPLVTYPRFVFNSTWNLLEACNEVDELRAHVNDNIPVYLHTASEGDSRLYIYFSEFSYASMDVNYSRSDALKFIKEYNYSVLSKVPVKDALSLQRNTVLLVIKDQTQIVQFRINAIQTSNTLLWTYVYYSELKGLNLSEKELPAMMLLEKNRTEYNVFKNVDRDSIGLILKGEVNSTFMYSLDFVTENVSYFKIIYICIPLIILAVYHIFPRQQKIE